MGNQAQARVEYDKAIQNAHTEADRLAYALQSATTWARESNFAEADKAFAAVAEKAHAAGLRPRRSRSPSHDESLPDRRCRGLEAVGIGRRGPDPSHEQPFGIRPSRRTGQDLALPRGPRRSRRQPRTRHPDLAAIGDYGRQHSQRCGAEFVSRRSRDIADGSAESSRRRSPTWRKTRTIPTRWNCCPRPTRSLAPATRGTKSKSNCAPATRPPWNRPWSSRRFAPGDQTANKRLLPGQPRTGRPSDREPTRSRIGHPSRAVVVRSTPHDGRQA